MAYRSRVRGAYGGVVLLDARTKKNVDTSELEKKPCNPKAFLIDPGESFFGGEQRPKTLLPPRVFIDPLKIGSPRGLNWFAQAIRASEASGPTRKGDFGPI